jgi:hypothetical protein
MLIGMAHTPLSVSKTSEEESRHTGERNGTDACYRPSSGDCKPAGRGRRLDIDALIGL